MADTEESPLSADLTLSPDISQKTVDAISVFMRSVGAVSTIVSEDSFSKLIGGSLKVVSIQRGKISCLLTVNSPLLNAYGGMHGGSVGVIAARVGTGCARTVVGEDKDLFLGELSMSYLSSAPHKAQVVIDGSVIRSGRNLTVVAIDIRLKETGRLAFLTRATFYHMPPSRL